jgi:hypothetical protein
VAKEDFIQHVLGGHQAFGRLETMVLPGNTVILKLERGVGGAIRSRPYVTVKDLHLTIRGHFIQEIDWDELDEEGDQ